MLLLDNICIRLREWRDQSEDPDLVPRFKRLWRVETEPRHVEAVHHPYAIPATFEFDEGVLTRLRQAS